MEQKMIEVIKNGVTIAIVPADNEEYYRSVHFKNDIDERKIIYKPVISSEEAERQRDLVAQKLDITRIREEAKELAKQEKLSNNKTQ